MLNRISGLFFDLMVTASIAAINLEAFKHREFILPLLLICVAGALVTYWYNLRVCRFLFPSYAEESFLTLYGQNTGTASTGIILLREIDPCSRHRLPTISSIRIYGALFSARPCCCFWASWLGA